MSEIFSTWQKQIPFRKVKIWISDASANAIKKFAEQKNIVHSSIKVKHAKIMAHSKEKWKILVVNLQNKWNRAFNWYFVLTWCNIIFPIECLTYPSGIVFP